MEPTTVRTGPGDDTRNHDATAERCTSAEPVATALRDTAAARAARYRRTAAEEFPSAGSTAADGRASQRTAAVEGA